MPPRAGHAFCQRHLDAVENPAAFRTFGQVAVFRAPPAWTLRQVTDFKIKLIPDNWHNNSKALSVTRFG